MPPYKKVLHAKPRAAPLRAPPGGKAVALPHVSDLLSVDNGVMRECAFVTRGGGAKVEAHTSSIAQGAGFWNTSAEGDHRNLIQPDPCPCPI